MQKPTQYEPALTPVDGVLFTRDFIARRRRAKNIIEKAKIEASHIMRSVQNDAAEIKALAMKEGFEEGVLKCAEIFAHWVKGHDALCQSVIEQGRSRLEQHALSLFSDTEFLSQLVNEWIAQQPLGLHNHISVRLCPALKDKESPLTALLTEKGLNVTVERSDAAGINVRCGDQILELLPGEFSEIMVSTAFDETRLRKDYHDLSIECSHMLIEKLTGHTV